MPTWLNKFTTLEPALLRGILVTLAAIVAKTFGVTVVDNETIDLIIDLFVMVSSLITALWARTVVFPQAKVIAFKRNPFSRDTISAGPATIDVYDENEVNALVEAGRSAA